MSNGIDCGIEQLALTDGSDPKPYSEDIIEYTIKYLSETYKTYKNSTTQDILHNLFGLVLFKLYNSTYPNGIANTQIKIVFLYYILYYYFQEKHILLELHKIILIVIQ